MKFGLTDILATRGTGRASRSSWRASRTRQLASALSMPVGFKNGTDGDVQVAVDACRASAVSHGNSGRDHTRQVAVAALLAEQIAQGQRGLVGVMLESFLVAGRQDQGDPATLTYGQSVTDACMDLDMTESALAELAASVQARRRSKGR